LRGVVSGVHLLPFYPWSSDDGFSVKDYFTVDLQYGGWEDVAQLRREGFDLMFDAVLNHASVQGEWFQRYLADDPPFRDFFFAVTGTPDLSRVVRPRALPLLTEFTSATGPRQIWTTFSADQADLNYQNPAVLLAAMEALLCYVQQGARFIRLDAIAFLWKEIGTPCLHLPRTHAVIRFFRAALDTVAPHVQLITETNVPHADNISYFGEGRGEAQLVYNFALPPLVLHSLRAGTAEKLTAWAESLRLPSRDVAFFNFLASHDGIGLNPARGILSGAEIDALVAGAIAHGGAVSYKNMPDGSRLPYELNINYLDALSNPAAGEPDALAASKFLTAHSILLTLAGMPGIYFHSLFGSRGDPAGAATSAIPRRINREKLDATKLETELGGGNPLRVQIWARLRRMLIVRRQTAAFHPHAEQRILNLDPRVFALERGPLNGGGRVRCLHNVSPEPVPLAAFLDGQPHWTDLLANHPLNTPGAEARLAGYQTLWLSTPN
jgi:sucrose phosphorylase